MEFVTVQDVNDPSVTDRVSANVFSRWPKSKKHPGARVRANGNRHMVIATDEQVEAAKVVKAAPRIPAVVERVLPRVEEAHDELKAEKPSKAKK